MSVFRELDHDDTVVVPPLRERYDVHHGLQGRVNAPDQRDSIQPPFPELYNLLADEVRGEEPGHEDQQDQGHNSQPRHVMIGNHLGQQITENAVHGYEEGLQNQKRAPDRRDDEETCQKVAF